MNPHRGWRIVLGIVVLTLASGCRGSRDASTSDPASLDGPDVRAALDVISADRIHQHMSTLADDALEGRGLGTPGFEGALRYVEKTLTSYGLAPAGENGGFRQRVPLRNSVVVEGGSSMSVRSSRG
ncbi:MAG: hypothetical protein ACRD2I_10960, partial [Vicinamibacterales bacterium]